MTDRKRGPFTIKVPRWLAWVLLVVGATSFLFGWMTRELLIFGAFFMLAGAYIGIRAVFSLFTGQL